MSELVTPALAIDLSEARARSANVRAALCTDGAMSLF